MKTTLTFLGLLLTFLVTGQAVKKVIAKSVTNHVEHHLPNDLNLELIRRVNLSINQGIAIATIDSLGKITYYNYGIEKKNSIITEHSTFEIASLSKTFTSTLIKDLVKSNQITLNQEIRCFLPDSLPEKIKTITIYQLINHTSGLPKLPMGYWTENWDNPYFDHTNHKLLTSLMHVQLDTAKKWHYSNMGYVLLGVIIDKVTKNNGIENLISKIGLKNTSANLDFITSTHPHNFGHKVENWDFPNFNRYMGGVKSSSSDLIKYLKYQINHNSDFSNSEFISNIIINEKDSLVNRNGWLDFYRQNEEIIWHNGISGGYNSFIGFNINTKSGIVIISNSQSSITDVGLHYLSSSFPLNLPLPSLCNKIEKYIRLNQLDSIDLTWYNYNPKKFHKNPIDLHWLQCHYISKQDLKVALLLNKLLASDYKDDWGVYYYRAKIYEMMGEYRLAKKTYKKVNKLLPDNIFIKTCLNTLSLKKKNGLEK